MKPRYSHSTTYVPLDWVTFFKEINPLTRVPFSVKLSLNISQFFQNCENRPPVYISRNIPKMGNFFAKMTFKIGILHVPVYGLEAGAVHPRLNLIWVLLPGLNLLLTDRLYWSHSLNTTMNQQNIVFMLKIVALFKRLTIFWCLWYRPTQGKYLSKVV